VRVHSLRTVEDCPSVRRYHQRDQDSEYDCWKRSFHAGIVDDIMAGSFRPLAIKGDSSAMLSGVESPLIIATK